MKGIHTIKQQAFHAPIITVVHELVIKLKGLTTWGALFKNKMWLSQDSFILLAASTGDSFHIQCSFRREAQSLLIYTIYVYITHQLQVDSSSAVATFMP